MEMEKQIDGRNLVETKLEKAFREPEGKDEVMELPSWVQYVVREEWTAELFSVKLMKLISIQKK